MLIDAHIHLYPSSVYKDARSWANHRKEPYWLSCVLPETGPTLQGWASVDQLLHDMDTAGIDKAVIQSWYWENHDTCEESLDWLIEWKSQHPDRLLAFAPFNAKGKQSAIDLLKKAFDSGLSGIGELNPPAQGYGYANPYLDEALELAATANKPVNFHVTDPDTRDYPGKIETPQSELQIMAQRHFNTKFIFAHLGGLMPFESLDNVWYDTAASPLLYMNPPYRDFCDKVGAGKVLFGTDYPLRTFPKTQKTPDFVHPLKEIQTSNLSEPELQAILGQNLAKLLNF